MSLSVAELHAAHPYDPDERCWSSIDVPFDAAARLAGEVHLQDDPVAYLDDLMEKDYKAAITINRSLLFLPPKVVFESLGEEVAVWSALNAPGTGDNDGLKAVLRDDAGYNLDDLEKARLWAWQKEHNSLGKGILAQYRLMQDMKHGLLDQVDVLELLVKSAQPGVELSQQRLSQYELIPLETEEQDGERVKDWYQEISDRLAYFLWLDAPTGYALTYKGLPNAMGGIAMRGLSELMLHQLQGVQAKTIDRTK